MKRIIARAGAPTSSVGVSRRMALRALAAMGLASPVLGHAATPALSPRSGARPRGTASDPLLRSPELLWDRSLSEAALHTLAVLADLILPADDRSPAASALGAHEFVDEWVSAPYPQQQEDRQVLLAGLEWLDAESLARFDAPFVKLETARQTAICDDICSPARAQDEHATGVAFFNLVRDLTAMAVWTTAAGMADLGYVGNVPLAKWDPPPAAVLKHLGLAD